MGLGVIYALRVEKEKSLLQFNLKWAVSKAGVFDSKWLGVFSSTLPAYSATATAVITAIAIIFLAASVASWAPYAGCVAMPSALATGHVFTSLEVLVADELSWLTSPLPSMRVILIITNKLAYVKQVFLKLNHSLVIWLI